MVLEVRRLCVPGLCRLEIFGPEGRVQRRLLRRHEREGARAGAEKLRAPRGRGRRSCCCCRRRQFVVGVCSSSAANNLVKPKPKQRLRLPRGLPLLRRRPPRPLVRGQPLHLRHGEDAGRRPLRRAEGRSAGRPRRGVPARRGVHLVGRLFYFRRFLGGPEAGFYLAAGHPFRGRALRRPQGRDAVRFGLELLLPDRAAVGRRLGDHKHVADRKGAAERAGPDAFPGRRDACAASEEAREGFLGGFEAGGRGGGSCERCCCCCCCCGRSGVVCGGLGRAAAAGQQQQQRL